MFTVVTRRQIVAIRLLYLYGHHLAAVHEYTTGVAALYYLLYIRLHNEY